MNDTSVIRIKVSTYDKVKASAKKNGRKLQEQLDRLVIAGLAASK